MLDIIFCSFFTNRESNQFESTIVRPTRRRCHEFDENKKNHSFSGIKIRGRYYDEVVVAVRSKLAQIRAQNNQKHKVLFWLKKEDPKIGNWMYRSFDRSFDRSFVRSPRFRSKVAESVDVEGDNNGRFQT
jgi:hypothetical protein